MNRLPMSPRVRARLFPLQNRAHGLREGAHRSSKRLRALSPHSLFRPLISNRRAIRTKAMIWLLKRLTFRFLADVSNATASVRLSGRCSKSDKDGTTIAHFGHLHRARCAIPRKIWHSAGPEWNLLAALWAPRPDTR